MSLKNYIVQQTIALHQQIIALHLLCTRHSIYFAPSITFCGALAQGSVRGACSGSHVSRKKVLRLHFPLQNYPRQRLGMWLGF